MPLHVEIWSDIACPWCYVGKRRFEAALAGWEHADEVEVTWRSFELEPVAPAELDHDLAQHLADKYGGGRAQGQAMLDSMTATAAEEGLEFRFDRARSGSTFDAHRLVHLAGAHGLQDAMKERLLRAYFTDGELVSDHDVLRRLAGEVGLPEAEVADLLAGDAFADEVRADEREATQLGITGVPFFVVDRAIGASGAQPPELLRSLLEQGWERAHPKPAIPVLATGEACGPEGC